MVITKGLDHDVKMKDSGVDWIGEMPESWMLNKLKFLSIVRASNIDKKSKDSEVPVSVCNYTDVYYNEKILSDNVFLSVTATIDQIKNFTVDVGDILMTKDSETPDWFPANTS